MSDNLKQIQRRFQDYLEHNSVEFANDIVSTDEALAEHRMAAYYNAYRIRLIDCLAIDYSVLQKELGTDNFEHLVLDYLKVYPSKNPSVRWLGKHMAEFILQSDHAENSFLAELAEFEWFQGLCFDSANAHNIFSLQDMALVDPENWPKITLSFHPAVRWLDLHWNVPPYWSDLDKDKDVPEKQYNDIPTRWLMWRNQHSPNWRSLDAAEAWAVEAAFNGANFAELCEGLVEWIGEDEVAITSAGFLKQWIHDELIVSVHT